jgi:sugar/nucleoside kinase (ribokinase family)
MSVLVVGSAALDSVETPFGKAEEVLGGSAVYFSMAVSFFTGVHVVAVVGEDFPRSSFDLLKKRSIDLEGLKQTSGKTFRWKGRYGLDVNNAETLDTQLNVFESFRPEIPERYRNLPYVFLANIDPDLQRDVLEQVARPRLVASDTMDFWIDGKRQSLLETIRRVDILVINESEAKKLSCEVNLVRAAAKIRSFGPRTLIIKQGEYGATMFGDGEIFSVPGFPLDSVKDPTGAGDCFAGGFVGHLAKGGDLSKDTLRQAVIFGSVMASFAVEDFSLNRLERLTDSEIEDRYRAFKRLTDFKDLS